MVRWYNSEAIRRVLNSSCCAPFLGEPSLLLGTGGPLRETFVSSAWGRTPVWISSTWAVLAASRASVCLHVCNSNSKNSSSNSHSMTWCGHSIKITGRNHLHPKDTSSKVWIRYYTLLIREWHHIAQNRQLRLNPAGELLNGCFNRAA